MDGKIEAMLVRSVAEQMRGVNDAIRALADRLSELRLRHSHFTLDRMDTEVANAVVVTQDVIDLSPFTDVLVGYHYQTQNSDPAGLNSLAFTIEQRMDSGWGIHSWTTNPQLTIYTAGTASTVSTRVDSAATLKGMLRASGPFGHCRFGVRKWTGSGLAPTLVKVTVIGMTRL